VAEKFHPKHASKLEDPARLVELPPERLIELLRLSGVETVVDFGAGTGMYSLPVASALPDGRVLAVDEQSVFLDRLHERLAEYESAGRVETVLSAEGRVPLPDGIAERMLTVNVLHHVHDEPRTLDEIDRLLAPGGILVAVEWARMDRPVGPSGAHVLALDEFIALVERLGLRVLDVHEPGDVGLYHHVIVAQKPQP